MRLSCFHHSFAAGFLLAVTSATHALPIHIEEDPSEVLPRAIQPIDTDLTDGYLKQYAVDSDGYISFSDTLMPDNGLVPVMEDLTTPDWFSPHVLDGRSPDALPVFTTGPDGSNTLVIDFTTLALDVFDFTFSLSANRRSHGWFDVHYTDGHTGHAMVEHLGGIKLGPNDVGNYVTRNFGVFGDRGSCTTISKIVVDPPPAYDANAFYWGAGNMAMGAGQCASVPEPGTVALLGIGLAALLLQRRRPHRSAPRQPLAQTATTRGS